MGIMGSCNCLRIMFLWYVYLLMMLVFSVCVQGDTPSSEGFLNIDCGLESNTSYIDGSTNLKYVSDDQYIDTGVKGNVSSQYRKDLDTYRIFPNSTRSCYMLTPVTEGSKYLVRAIFYYGNFDGLASPRTFDLYFGVNFWQTAKIGNYTDSWYTYEIIGVAPSNYIEVCLVNTGNGIPFISVLELRPLSSTLYPLADYTQFLSLFARRDVSSNYDVVRFPDDAHDRIWLNHTKSYWTTISTESRVDGFTYEVPSNVMQTAAIPSDTNGSIDLGWPTPYNSSKFLIMLYFAEVQKLTGGSLREFCIYLNGDNHVSEPISLSYLYSAYFSYTLTPQAIYNVSIKRTPNATLPPLLNAFEIYTILPVVLLPTHSGDVIAVNTIKASYNVRKAWSGDPCVPTNFSWAGLNCTANSSNIPRITTLNLSSIGLKGKMVSAFGSLTGLEILDLSQNNLSGNIPSSLDQLESLKYLDLSENSGLLNTLPPNLQRKMNNGQLIVKLNGTASAAESKKSSKTVIIIIVVIVIVLLVLGAVGLCVFYQKKQRSNRINLPAIQGQFRTLGTEVDTDISVNTRQFTFAELKLVTGEFGAQIGIGGFGKVFRGCLESGKEVAVKMCSESSPQGVKQFLNEVENLSRVHHKNLVSLIGYCSDKDHIALVYENMKEGNLQDWLRGRKFLVSNYNNLQDWLRGKSWLLPWKERLRIAYESAQGLEYLHKMCNPPLIHRDVKSNNILLTRNLEAKISDFGLVRVFTDTHVTTQVVGTPGYLDPYYASTLQLTEKSDVYSFGVVLLEIITGKSPILEDQHLIDFVKQKLSKGNIESILDQKMKGEYNLNSIWKVVDLALQCTDQPAKRPDMTVVVTELKESLHLEMSTNYTGSVALGDTDMRAES